MNLNKLLKNNSIIFNLNAKYKCRNIKKQYKNIVQYYDTIKEDYNFGELLDKKGFTNEWSKQFETRKLNIFYLGTDELQDKSGFLQALEKHANIDLFIREDGSYGHAKEYTQESKLDDSNRLKYLIETSSVKYDILMMQSWGSTIDVETLIELKKKFNLKIINISMDDRHTFWINNKSKNGLAELLPAIDLSLTAAPEAVQWYHKENIPSLFFPEASDPNIFHPLDREKIYDVGFVGAKYGIREKIVQELIVEGINVKAYGNGWESGRLPLNETNEFYNQCKIVLGIGTIGYCEDFYALKLRDFDVPMSGNCYITSNNNDLLNLFNEDDIVLYDNIRDCVKKVKNILQNNKYKDLALNGRKMAIGNHTYENRLQEIFKIIRVNSND